MKIIPLSEGAFTVDQSKQFLPFRVELDDLQARTRGSILVEIQPFCVVTSKDIIILDTGLGFADDKGQMQIHKNLSQNGISCTDVTKVLLTHLHKDHSGGIARPGKKELSFINANYYINSNEWKYAFEKGFPSYITDDFLLLKSSSQLYFIKGGGNIDQYIHYEETGGHSPFHQVFMVEDGGEKIFYGGDVAPQLQQMKNKFKAKYDFDGAKAMELRMNWWQKGEKENWTFLFYHDIKYPVYKFENDV